MKRFLSILMALALIVGCVTLASADDGNVTYSGTSGEFIFAPGSEHSVTDLFPNFKGVMPGDQLHQKISLKNNASKEVKIKLYIRALGAQEGSEAFLSQLNLKVESVDGMEYMFNASADQTAQLTDWVYLGTLYSGGTVDLNVVLEVPVTMGNEFQNQIGYLDWEFKVEELPVEPTDPKPPQTGVQLDIDTPLILMGVSAVMIFFIILLLRKKKKEDED